MKLKEDYILAKCCSPREGDPITGYYSHDNFIKVHKSDCPSIKSTDKERLMTLKWSDIIAAVDFTPGPDYEQLNEIDFAILRHHKIYGVDYSLKVAAMTHIEKQAVFESHQKLRKMRLLERVEPLMIQYRSG